MSPVRRVQLDEAIQRADRLGVAVAHVLAIGGEQLGVGGPGRIGVLALDRLEQLHRPFVLLGADRLDAGGVERVGRLVGGVGARCEGGQPPVHGRGPSLPEQAASAKGQEERGMAEAAACRPYTTEAGAPGKPQRPVPGPRYGG